MSHDSNRIFGNVRVKEDIYGFFNLSTTYTGGSYSQANGIELICAIPLINMWARNKPEAIGAPDKKLTDAERKANNFGLRPPTTYQSVSAFSDAIQNGTLSGWTYDYPRRTRRDPFRCGDFDNYRADSRSPFPSFGGGDCLIFTNSQGRNEIKIQLAAGYQGVTGNTDYINLNDLQMSGADFSNWYPGIYIRQSNSVYWLITSDGTLGSSLEITLNTAERTLPSAGSYQCYVFMSNQKFKLYSGSGLAVSGGVQIVPITTNPVTMNVVTSAQALTVTAVHMLPRHCAVTVRNLNARQIVITPVRIEHASGGNGEGTVSDVGPSEMAAFTVPAGSTSNPQIVEKTYSIRPVLSGSLRLVYKYTDSNGIAVTAYTPWATIISQSI